MMSQNASILIRGNGSLIIYFLFLGESFIFFLVSFLNLVKSYVGYQDFFLFVLVSVGRLQSVFFFCLFLFIYLCIPAYGFELKFWACWLLSEFIPFWVEIGHVSTL